MNDPHRGWSAPKGARYFVNVVFGLLILAFVTYLIFLAVFINAFGGDSDQEHDPFGTTIPSPEVDG